jgi:release factor glutamine methyltransferase
LRTADSLLRSADLPRTEARALLASALRVARERLIAFPETEVPPPALAAYEALIARRREGEPLAYLLGEMEFYSRRFAVTHDVLVPRPDTETLVEVALECLSPMKAPRVLDLGTGSGCIAITLQLERPDARLVATDVSAAALEVAGANARDLCARVTFRQGDWFAAVEPAERFDLIVSNPPYVAAADPHLDALRHEPAMALTDGHDGLQCLSTLTAGARAHLRAGAWLALEHGYDQSPAVERLLREAGFREITLRRDGGGQPRVTFGRA